MLRHKNIERICCLVLAVTILVTCLYMAAAAAGLVQADHNIGYENRLFDQSYVHTIDIVMDDWEGFLDTCTSEVYASCTLVIDGEKYSNVAIRGKGNTSLSSVASYGNDRYSFKVEFDHYQTGKTYHGLDKLCLNNLIYDNTYMKDYLAYTLMGKMGVASPLCSFVEIRVNGETFGTYLAVEGVEESFLKRNYGSDYGELYKPDTMNFGGGRGNGGDFDMNDFMEDFDQEAEAAPETQTEQQPEAEASDGFDNSFGGSFGGSSGESTTPDNGGFTMPEGVDPSQFTGGEMPAAPEGGSFEMPEGMEMPDMGGFNMFGMGSSGTKLQYVDDDPASYDTIFSSAKTNVSENDQTRLIAALKKLSEGDTSAVDEDAMLRYLAVHDFLQNGDSYTGMMVHNYYLYEEDGVLSMIPWDYNLAFGTFTGGNGQSTINSNIDTPVSGSTGSDRPMVGWVFKSEESIAAYHEVYQQFISEYFASGWYEEEVTRMANMLTPYVANDPTAFCTFEEFEKGVEAIRQYGALRAQSIQNQLDGNNQTVDANALNLSDMGSMNNGGGGFGGGMPGGGRSRDKGADTQPDAQTSEAPAATDMPAMPDGAQLPEGVQLPEGFEMPAGGEGPDGSSSGQTAATDAPTQAPTQAPTDMPAMPEGAQLPEGVQLPEGFEMPAGGEGSDGSSSGQTAVTDAPSAAPAATDMPAMPQGGEMPAMPDGAQLPEGVQLPEGFEMPAGGEGSDGSSSGQTAVTDAPTEAPTEVPTEAPTDAPTQTPAAPTETPESPAESPSAAPAEKVSRGGDMKFPTDRTMTSQGSTQNQQLLLIVCLAVLLMALLAAALFKNHR